MEKMSLLKKLHDHISSELSKGASTDTVFVITSVLLNLVVLAINSTIAQGRRSRSPANYISFILFIVIVIIVNTVAYAGLSKGMDSRIRLMNGLIRMYKDNGIDKYYDVHLKGNYVKRYYLFLCIVISLGFIAVVIPCSIFASA